MGLLQALVWLVLLAPLARYLYGTWRESSALWQSSVHTLTDPLALAKLSIEDRINTAEQHTRRLRALRDGMTYEVKEDEHG